MKLRTGIDALIYLSVIFGVILLVQLWFLVPRWLFYSVFVGWIGYSIVAVLAATGRRAAYPAALVLAFLTLLVSLPQPEHYAYIASGLTLTSMTLVSGSVLQILLILLDGIYLIRLRRKKSGLLDGRSKSAHKRPIQRKCCLIG